MASDSEDSLNDPRRDRRASSSQSSRSGSSSRLSQSGSNTNQSPLSQSTSQTSMHRAPRHRFATFTDLRDEEELRNQRGPSSSNFQDLFAGGEKSGLAVTPQGSDDLVNNLIRRAQEQGMHRQAYPDDDDEDDDFGQSRSREPSFQGNGFRLGSSTSPTSKPSSSATPGASSSATPGPSASASSRAMGVPPTSPPAPAGSRLMTLNQILANFQEELGESANEFDDELLPPADSENVVVRTLNLWDEGYSISDGPLMRFSDPENVANLRAISMGRAPLHLLNVRPGQVVDVTLVRHNAPFRAAPASLNNSGPGQRLGSPSVPETTHATPGTPAASQSPATQSQATESQATPAASSQLGNEGDALVQVRLANGTSVRARFSRDGPVQQLYDFVDERTDVGRRFVLLLMPAQKLEDRQQSLHSAGAVGAVVVQRFI